MNNPDRRSLLQAVGLGSAAALLASRASAETPADILYVIAEIVAKPESADQLRDLLVPFAAISAKEPGCLEYTLMEVDKEPGRFLTFERWTGRSALDAHMKTADIGALVSKLESVLAKPFTQIFLGAPEKAV